MHLLSDARFTLRLLRRSPAFFATLLLVLAAGIGANTAMISIVESLLLRPLPYPDPGQLTVVWRTDPQLAEAPASVPDFLDWRASATDFEHMAALEYTAVSLASDGAATEAVYGARVSADFFPALGVRALYGRLLGPDDDRVGGPPVAVIGAALFERRFGGDPAIVGKTISLDSVPFTVVGVAPRTFTFRGPRGDGGEIWTPLAATSAVYAHNQELRGSHFLDVIGRRKPGVSLAQAQAQLSAVARRLEERYPNDNARKGVLLVELHDALVQSSRSSVWLLFAAVGLVFVILCANVANLLLARAQSRRAEIALRAALGATPARLVGQVVTETAVVFGLGAAGGLVIARWLIDLFADGLVEGGGARTIAIQLNPVALGASICVSLACGMIFGLVPALAVSRVAPHAVMKEDAARAGVGQRQHVARNVLVVAQVALAFALLVGSGLVARAFARTAAIDPGFDAEGIATARLILSDVKYADGARATRFYDDVLQRVAAEPGVLSVAANSTLPMGGSNSSGSFRVEGRAPWPPGEGPNLERNVVTPGYFTTMGIPILRGRDFDASDHADARRVVVVSQAVVDRFFPGEDPIGRRIAFGDVSLEEPRWREIIGVVGDVRRRGLDEAIAIESFVPLAQEPNRWMFVVARTRDPQGLLRRLQALVQPLDPEQAISNPRTMEERVARSISSQRYLAVLLVAFAFAALFLATLGLFGVMSYVTGQRTRELGIRIALGAPPRAVIGLVVKSGARLVGLGLAIGLALALVGGRLLANRVPELASFDPVIYGAIPLILGITGMMSCLVPAVRAVRIPPAIALRYE